MSGLWHCQNLWQGQVVCILGGGPSLKEANWLRMHSLFSKFGIRTIACNDGYQLGWPDAVFFGDYRWAEIHHNLPAFQQYQGMKIACEADCIRFPEILVLERRPLMFRLEPHLCGWYSNTGISAINLAVKLGAKAILLLGFDMKLKEGVSNWYTKLKDPVSAEEVYHRFLKHAAKLASDMKEVCPDTPVINCTPDSALTVFPQMQLTSALDLIYGKRC